MASSLWNSLYQARSKIAVYVDALWDGKASADDASIAFYQDRLATAARLLSLLNQGRRIPEAQALLRSEDSKFGRDVLSTVPGRSARAAFNQIARTLAAVEDFRLSDGHLPRGIETLVGENLSSVTFIQDYVELGFDGQSVQACGTILIREGDFDMLTGDVTFRNALCALISRQVTAVAVGSDSVAITFGTTKVDLHFNPQSPEPVVFNDGDGGTHYYP